jgi:hypothetical protein
MAWWTASRESEHLLRHARDRSSRKERGGRANGTFAALTWTGRGRGIGVTVRGRLDRSKRRRNASWSFAGEG